MAAKIRLACEKLNEQRSTAQLHEADKLVMHHIIGQGSVSTGAGC